MNRLDAKILGFQDDYLIISPPYLVSTSGFNSPGELYLLRKKGSEKVFSCRVHEKGIYFIPLKAKPDEVPVTNLTWKKDTIKGYTVFETWRYLPTDTLRSWNTDAFGIDDPVYKYMKGVPLIYESLWDGEIYRITIHNIDTVNISTKYFNPQLSNTPIHFESPKEAFDYDIQLSLDHTDKTAYKCPNLKGELLNQDLKVNIKKLQGNIVVMIFIDYDLTEELPYYLKEWILPLRDSLNIKPYVFTRSDKTIVLEMFKKDPDLESIPHMLVNEEQYLRIGGYGPLYVLLLDQGGVIRYNENGYYLFSTDVLDQKIKFLQESWEK